MPHQRIDWRAIFLGAAMGVVWKVFEGILRHFLIRYYITTYPNGRTPPDYVVWGGTALILVLTLAYGTTVGFVVGYYSRHRPYRAAVLVIVFLFAAHHIVVAIQLTLAGHLSALLAFQVADLMFLGMLILSLAAALNGAYLAQSVKRNRGVRIQ